MLLLTQLKQVFLAAFAVLALATGNAAAAPLKVVASFSILGDLAQQIGGERIELHTLVGPDGDAHVYQPTPADAKTIAEANLVIVNGFGFEGWIGRLVMSSGYRGPVLVASNGIKTLKLKHDEHGHGHDSDVDPHAWQDLSNALRYVDNIAQALAKADPAGQSAYLANAAKYKQEIVALDGELKTAFNSIAKEKRMSSPRTMPSAIFRAPMASPSFRRSASTPTPNRRPPTSDESSSRYAGKKYPRCSWRAFPTRDCSNAYARNREPASAASSTPTRCRKPTALRRPTSG